MRKPDAAPQACASPFRSGTLIIFYCKGVMDYRLSDPAVSSVSLRFDDSDGFADALFGGEFQTIPLPGQAYAATLKVLRVADMVVQHAEEGPHIARAAMHPGIAALLLPCGSRGRLARINGSEIGSGAALLPGGAELAAHCVTDTAWVAVAVPLALLEQLAEVAPPAVRVAGAVSLLDAEAPAWRRLAAAMIAGAGVLNHSPATAPGPGPGPAEGFAMSLREMIADALTVAATARPHPRSTADMVRVVRDTEAYLDSRLAKPIYTEELCAALGVSPRKLHDAFVAICGMSPHAYLKRRRLMLVRRALRRGGFGPTLVKSVALSHGFWHLGHFAHDYRALFGETPSETLAAVGGDRRRMPVLAAAE
jgi:AraC family ethanolamine operon transcriptional activator